ncbi:MAG: sulfite exporter TauE/SafE family protein [Clostridia bacterium]|nr:sulfite exporter TauE/SafE family protein [Clostridia bacterium]
MQKSKKKQTKWWVDGLLGSIIGFVNGFLGSGGGMIAVPMLEKIKNLETKKAHATAVAVMFPFSVISGVVYIFNFELDWLILGIMIVAATLGGMLGCFALKKMPGKVIRGIFAVLMAFAGVWILVV